MKTLMMGLSLAVLATSAAAAEDCAGKSDLFALNGWAAVDHGRTQKLVLGVVYSGQPISMIDATVGFKDALGRPIGENGFIKPDSRISPNPKPVSLDGMIAGASRLTEADKSLVSVTICVRAVAYADGSVETFEQH
jgi:opacity protein-like surface antigen